MAVCPKASGHQAVRRLSWVFSTSALLAVLLEGQAQETQDVPHPKSWVPSHCPESPDCRPRSSTVSLLALPHCPPLPIRATLDLHLVSEAHACASRTIHTPKQAFLPCKPCLFCPLCLQLTLPAPFLLVQYLPWLPAWPRRLPWCLLYSTIRSMPLWCPGLLSFLV